MGNDFNTADTSPAILEAIWRAAGGDEVLAARIHQDPTEEEKIAIWERVTKNGLIDARVHRWGTLGYEWAKDILAAHA